jgi:phosphoribosyl 1,2-cyclic phosphodiesterase
MKEFQVHAIVLLRSHYDQYAGGYVTYPDVVDIYSDQKIAESVCFVRNRNDESVQYAVRTFTVKSFDDSEVT